jgi:hypothetical protein
MVTETKSFVSNLRTVAEQLYLIAHATKRTFPAPVEMSSQSMAFLKVLGVPIIEKADLARGTVYSQLDELNEWAKGYGVVISGR